LVDVRELDKLKEIIEQEYTLYSRQEYRKLIAMIRKRIVRGYS
jgi:hypothetical protein